MKIKKIDLYLIFTFIMLITFTIYNLILLLLDKQLNDTLITCFFGVFGGEIVGCVVLKSLNIKKGDPQ